MSTDTTPRTIRLLRYVHALMGFILYIFLAFILLNTFLVTTFTVQGHSMDPTLHDGQILFVSLQSYRVQPPKIGDVVIVYYAGDHHVRFVKRILGLPGDTVQVGGKPVVLGSTQYYVVGDNRDHSTDSRTYGPIDKKQIIGKVVGPLAEPQQ